MLSVPEEPSTPEGWAARMRDPAAAIVLVGREFFAAKQALRRGAFVPTREGTPA